MMELWKQTCDGKYCACNENPLYIEADTAMTSLGQEECALVMSRHCKLKIQL